MRILKLISAYLFWTVLSLFIGIGYMRLVLGPNTVSEEGLGYLLHLFYDIGMIQVGLWVGGAIATCFVLLDVFYLRKKLKNSPKKIIIRIFYIITRSQNFIFIEFPY